VTNPVAKIQAQFSRIVRGDYIIDGRYVRSQHCQVNTHWLKTLR